MQVVWEANTADFAKRKRAARACESCQKRKKRCHHTFSRESKGDDAEIDHAISKLTRSDTVRFVGDTNPESILTDLSTRSKGVPRQNKLGTWIQPVFELDRHDLIPTTPATKLVPAAERERRLERGRRTLTAPQRSYLQAVGAFRVLPKATQDVLVTSYIASIDGLLPILNGGRFLEAYSTGTASPFLVQAVCLVACKTAEATPYLRLEEDGPLMDPISFARTVYTGLDAAMKADLESDRLTKVQILTLISLHNDGPGGIEESSLHLLQAIHESHTAGLHILTAGRRTTDQASYTWWCIWVLDKINACIGGRAIMIADRDMGLPRPEIVDSDLHSRSAALRMWLALADVLTEVIAYYRPGADQDCSGWEEGFPTFQDVSLGTSVAFNFDIPLKSHRDLLEIFYNVIAILTCRAGGPNTPSCRRRVIAADRIQALMTATNTYQTQQDHLGSSQDSVKHPQQAVEELPPLPLVPYAISLALTVAYRQLRDPLASTDHELVRKNLGIRCTLLEGLSKRWWSADAMAKLGRRALQPSKNSARATSGKENKIDADELSAVGDLMDTEVAVCKHEPFLQDGLGSSAGHASEKSSDRNGTHIDHHYHDQGIHAPEKNALEVLSSAAVAHGHRPNTQYLHDDMRSTRDVLAMPPYPTLTESDLPSATSALLPLAENIASYIDSNIPNSETALSDQEYLDSFFNDFYDVGMPTDFIGPMFDGDAFWEGFS